MSALSRLNPIDRHRARCRHVRGQMSELLDGQLDRADAHGVERHVRWCPNCARVLRNLRRTVQGLAALRDVPAGSGPTDRA